MAEYGQLLMQSNNDPIPLKRGTDEIYATSNIAVRWLGKRFLKKIYCLLKDLNSFSKLGLNVGCGEGQMIYYLHEKRAIGHMASIDIGMERLEFAKTNFPVCNYLKADVNMLGFKPNTFDYILATEIFEHLEDPIKSMKEIRRVAKDNAYVIISIPYEPFFHWGNLLRGKHWKTRGYTPSHVNFWKRSEFRMFLSEYAEIIKEHHITTFPWLVYFGKFKTEISK